MKMKELRSISIKKTIDRIFEVTEHSASIKWGVYGIDGEFIDVFLMHHKAKI